MAESIRVVLEAQPWVCSVEQAESGPQAVRMAVRDAPDLVIMDLALPGLNGIEATRQIIRQRPEVKILAYSVHTEAPFVVAMLEAGASGYSCKASATDELVQAVRAVSEDQLYLSPRVAKATIETYRQGLSQSNRPRGFIEGLSPRECQVLQLLAEGRSIRDIAVELDLSVRTVGSHREGVMRKLDIHSTAGLTKYALQKGLTSLDW
jgi:DNA-binding NarL/FixJ family response regulator